MWDIVIVFREYLKIMDYEIGIWTIGFRIDSFTYSAKSKKSDITFYIILYYIE